MTPLRVARRTAGRIVRSVPWLRRQYYVSCDYTLVSEAEARTRPAGGWFRPLTALRQDRAYRGLLAAMHAGDPRIDLRVAADAVDAVGLPEASLLEVGCGSGYYSEVFATLCRTKLSYTGLDYSEAMVARARVRYPNRQFEIGNAASLSWPDSAFDIVFNGVSLMHILDYEKAISESARVARRACIFHSVPVFMDHPTVHIHKYAYGSPVVEMVFSRDELLRIFERHGLKLARSWDTIPYDVSHVVKAKSHAETFLCLTRGSE
jgi:ubiquinone/menaquinone biosynthesis C-methylase UbiE